MADKAPSTQILLYQTEDQRTRIEVRLENETVWLNQLQMAELFQTTVPNVSMHIRNVFHEGELERESVVKDFLTTGADGKIYQTKFYNLDVIISVGYRVRSHRGTQFRIWATQRLREYLIKGFTLDDERLKQVGGGNYFDELLARIRDIRSSEKVFWRKVLDIYATSIDYDPSAEASERFFATVQNKMHWAAHGHTAAEIIADRADATRPTMGLTSWSGGRVQKTDVAIAKNYLTADELDALNRIVTAYLESPSCRLGIAAPCTCRIGSPSWMNFLRLSEREILNHAGRISHEVAVAKAEGEFEKFQVGQLAQPTEVEKQFEAMVKKLKRLPAGKTTRKRRKKGR